MLRGVRATMDHGRDADGRVSKGGEMVPVAVVGGGFCRMHQLMLRPWWKAISVPVPRLGLPPRRVLVWYLRFCRWRVRKAGRWPMRSSAIL